MHSRISLVVLTKNEEANLARCLASVSGVVAEMVVVDNGDSTDGTRMIAEKFGARFLTHEFKNQAQQFNWALDNVELKGDWILRLDADEALTPELAEEIAEVLPQAREEVSGFLMKRRVYFLGRWMRHGGYYPSWFLRLFRRGKGRSEEREMDEHIVLLEGHAEELRGDFVDDNKKGLSEWIQKHNGYSTREVSAHVREEGERVRLAGQAGRRRFMKQSFYYRSPMFLRAFAYWFYRYIIRLGFLDGTEGLVFHFLQGFWYRFLVDAKLFELRHISRNHE